WQHDVRFRNFSVTTGASQQKVPFEYDSANSLNENVRGMWRAIRRGAVTGSFSLESQDTFSGRQSQQITFANGSGIIGIENQGLNRWGMNFVKGKSYEGYVYVRASVSTEFFASLESRDGQSVYDEKRLKVAGRDWQRLNFTLKPKAAERTGRFAIK